MNNQIHISFPAIPLNEGVARMVISGFLMGIDPTIQELEDVKTAVSEAVSNAVIHAYPGSCGEVRMHATLDENKLELTIEDDGVGIADVQKAMEPMFTSCQKAERSGMGFTFMESFMDTLSVQSNPDEGCRVCMTKIFGKTDAYEM